jgi:hypothetical protein
MSVTNCILTGPSAPANAVLAAALQTASPGLTVSVVAYPDMGTSCVGPTIFLMPQGKQADQPWPRRKYSLVSLDMPLAEQVTQALELLGLAPGQNDPAGKMGGNHD